MKAECKNLTIDIIGQDYDLKFEKGFAKDGSANGLIVYEDLEIYIEDSLRTEKKKEILLHEIIHGISEGLSMGLEENAVQALARSLYSVIKQNKTIFSWMVAETTQNPQQF